MISEEPNLELVALLVEALKKCPGNTITAQIPGRWDREKVIKLLTFRREIGNEISVKLLCGYTLTERSGSQGITCNVCNMTSFHPEDVKQKYCSKCGMFHDDRAAQQAMTANRKIEVTQ